MMQGTILDTRKKLLTVKEVAAAIGTNQTYVNNLINRGLLPAMKLGCKKVREADLDKFLESAVGKDYSDLDNITELKKDVG